MKYEKVSAIVISESLCCEELPIYTKDNITQEYKMKQYMQQFTMNLLHIYKEF